MRVTRPGRFVPLLFVLIGLAGCDRTPMDPTLEPGLDALLPVGARGAVYSPSPTSLPSLFRAAVISAQGGRGASSPEKLLSVWRQLNEEARLALKAGDQQTARAKVDALRAEELGIVQRHLGRRGVHRVVAQVGEASARIGLRLAESTRDVSRVRPLLDQVAAAVRNANAALEAGDHAAALDQATRASDLLDSAAHFLITLQRIPALETQFPQAAAKVAREQGTAAAQALLADVDAANQEARAALRSGDRERARRRLETVRNEQIRVVLHVLGPRVVPSLIDQVDGGIAAAQPTVRRIAEPRQADRAHKMLIEAGSLNVRAQAALDAGDPATALDLASHAAGLVNAVRHLLPR
jgi:hypothetical protein